MQVITQVNLSWQLLYLFKKTVILQKNEQRIHQIFDAAALNDLLYCSCSVITDSSRVMCYVTASRQMCSCVCRTRLLPAQLMTWFGGERAEGR